MIETAGLSFLLGVLVTVAVILGAATKEALSIYALLGYHYGRSLVDVVLPTGRHARRWWR